MCSQCLGKLKRGKEDSTMDLGLRKFAWGDWELGFAETVLGYEFWLILVDSVTGCVEAHLPSLNRACSNSY